MNPRDRFLDLSSRFLDGETSDAETAELSELLKQDGEARRTLARLISQHGNLHWILAKTKMPQPLPETDAPSRRAPRVGALRARSRRQRTAAPSSPILWLSAAAVFIVLLLGALLSTGDPAVERPAPRPEARSPQPAPPTHEKLVDRPAAPKPPSERPPVPGEKPRSEKKVAAPPVRPAPAPDTTPAPVTPRPAPPSRPRKTEAAPARALAVLEKDTGETPVREGQTIKTDADSAVLAFPDGTRVELAPRTLIRRVSEREKNAGKFLDLAIGKITADVTRQPAGRPLVVATPQARARVVGTRFTLEAQPKSTRLEVAEGKVRLARPSGITSVLVPSGYFAVAAPGAPLEARPLPVRVAQISFGPAGAPVPQGYRADTGAVFDAQRGYGWARDLSAGTRLRTGPQPVLHRRSVIAGSALVEARWEYAVPKGTYEVTVVCGGELTAQGPHRVTVEGSLLFKDVFSAKGAHPARTATVQVQDGRLTLTSGAVGTTLRAPDGTHDTIINYLVISRIR